MHGTPASAARRATPRAVLPNAVWASIRPSPVMTRSAPASRRREVGRLHHEVDARAQRERAEPIRRSRAGRTRRRRRRRRRACRAPGARSAASSASAKAASRRSRSATSSGDAPFCGPYDGGRAGRAEERVRDVAGDRRCRAEARRGSRPARSALAASRSVPAPSPRSRPAPPSVVALPPIPRIDRGARPRRGRPGSASPVPSDVAATASRSDVANRDSPDASAISTTARCRSSDVASQRARTGRPSGSPTVASRHAQPPAAATASSVPSPPSASGHSRIVSPGRARAQPSARARATSTEVSEPLNESGAMRTVRGRPPSVSRRGAGRATDIPLSHAIRLLRASHSLTSIGICEGHTCPGCGTFLSGMSRPARGRASRAGVRDRRPRGRGAAASTTPPG